MSFWQNGAKQEELKASRLSGEACLRALSHPDSILGNRQTISTIDELLLAKSMDHCDVLVTRLILAFGTTLYANKTAVE